MSAPEYHFVTHWRLPHARIGDVAAILADPLDLPRWWPAVYLDVRELQAGDATGVGREVDLLTKGWLPYTLRWRFTIAEIVPPSRIALTAAGDFVGRGVWTLTQDGDAADVTYDWRIRAEKPLLRRLSWLLRPLFSANHRWAMARGEESLRIELARRQRIARGEPAVDTRPPGPTGARTLLAPAVCLGAVLVGVGAALRRRR